MTTTHWRTPIPSHHLPAIGAVFLPGNEIELLHDGEQIYGSMLDAIRSAESSIDLESYAWWAGEVTETFADALRDAARRGVDVRLLVDLMGARLTSDPTLYKLEDDGVQVATFRKPSLRRPTTLTHRSHRRILVVDQEIGFTGGAGIGDEWLRGGDEFPRGWRDLHARIRGPLVQMLESEFIQDFAIARSDSSLRSPVLVEPRGGGIEAALIRSVPQPDRTPIAIAFEAMFGAAEESIDIYSAFLAPHHDAIRPLTAAAQRGVRVRILIPSRRHVDKAMAAFAAESTFPHLLEAGVEIYRFTPTMLHAKASVIDRRLVSFGTPNINGRSFQRDRELMVVAADPDLGSELAARFEQDLEEAEQVTGQPETSAPGRLVRYGFDRLAHLLSSHI